MATYFPVQENDMLWRLMPEKSAALCSERTTAMSTYAPLKTSNCFEGKKGPFIFIAHEGLRWDSVLLR